MKILIIDDHPLIREALRHVLKVLDAGIQLVEAQNFAEGITAADSHPDLDLILLDLGLPDIDGNDALVELRRRYPAVPTVVLSASEHPATVTRAIETGAMGFIPKTTSSQLLLNALRLVLAGGVYLPTEVLRQHQGTPEPALRLAAEASDSGKLLEPSAIGLTERQSDVLALLVQGKSNKLICRDLGLAEGTVKIHVTAILKALNVSNRTQAVIAVGKLGLQLPKTPRPK
ncbi:MAG: response regulator transcription factor [Burkholderiales bacterium]